MRARLAALVVVLGSGGMVAFPTSGWSADPSDQGRTSSVPVAREYSVLGAARDSLFGDPYVDPERWQPLSLSTFLSEGWDEPWINPPKGGGGAPRQSWLNAFNGVFYRLFSFTFDWAHDGGDDNEPEPADGQTGSQISMGTG